MMMNSPGEFVRADALRAQDSIGWRLPEADHRLTKGGVPEELPSATRALVEAHGEQLGYTKTDYYSQGNRRNDADSMEHGTGPDDAVNMLREALSTPALQPDGAQIRKWFTLDLEFDTGIAVQSVCVLRLSDAPPFRAVIRLFVDHVHHTSRGSVEMQMENAARCLALLQLKLRTKKFDRKDPDEQVWRAVVARMLPKIEKLMPPSPRLFRDAPKCPYQSRVFAANAGVLANLKNFAAHDFADLLRYVCARLLGKPLRCMSGIVLTEAQVLLTEHVMTASRTKREVYLSMPVLRLNQLKSIINLFKAAIFAYEELLDAAAAATTPDLMGPVAARGVRMEADIYRMCGSI